MSTQLLKTYCAERRVRPIKCSLVRFLIILRVWKLPSCTPSSVSSRNSVHISGTVKKRIIVCTYAYWLILFILKLRVFESSSKVEATQSTTLCTLCLLRSLHQVTTLAAILYETAEKSNRFFFIVNCTRCWRVGCPAKMTTVTMRFCYYMQWVINVKEVGTRS